MHSFAKYIGFTFDILHNCLCKYNYSTASLCLKFEMPSKRLKRQFPWETPLKVYPAITFNPKAPTWTQFLKMSCADGSELERASPFFLQRAIKAQIGQPKKIKKLRDGSLLIEAATET